LTKHEQANGEGMHKFVFAPHASFVIGHDGRKRACLSARESCGQFI